MKQEIKVPSVGESITQGILAAWLKGEGEIVEEGDDLLELETDKATVTVPAPTSGKLSIGVKAGTEVSIGAVVGWIDTEARVGSAPQPDAGKAAAPRPASAASSGPAAGRAAPVPPAPAPGDSSGGVALSPAVRRIVEEAHLEPGTIPGTGKGGRITKEDALKAAAQEALAAGSASRAAPPSPASTAPLSPAPRPAAPAARPIPAPRSGASVAPRGQRRAPMTTIRKRTAEKLVEAQRNTAYLTTFNEIDMGKVMDLRGRYKEEFERAHGVKLGFMSFFVKACCQALKASPEVNALIDGEEIVFNDACHIGVAVSTERGLMVPVVRDADLLGLAEIEAVIADLAARARDRKILPDELAGGTFSITNGGVFGSLLSTPLPNYPQAAILGMHSIQRRPVVSGSAPGGEQVVVRPMMYVALTYDHRLIDGKDAVGFLRHVKDLVEDPDRLLLEV